MTKSELIKNAEEEGRKEAEEFGRRYFLGEKQVLALKGWMADFTAHKVNVAIDSTLEAVKIEKQVGYCSRHQLDDKDCSLCSMTYYFNEAVSEQSNRIQEFKK